MYDDILSLIFGNFTNAQYFKKYYGDTKYYQLLYRDWKKLEFDKNKILNSGMPVHEIR